MNVTPIIPAISLPGDRDDQIMARNGQLMGLTKTRALWRFGFLPGSDFADAFGVKVDAGFYWVISTHSGKVLYVFTGMALELPDKFEAIVGFEIG